MRSMNDSNEELFSINTLLYNSSPVVCLSLNHSAPKRRSLAPHTLRSLRYLFHNIQPSNTAQHSRPPRNGTLETNRSELDEER
jgi:hypothetical protein